MEIPTNKYIDTIHGKISYFVKGTNDKAYIAFHRYGASKAVFNQIGDIIASKYTIVAIDLPFHGDTLWNSDFYTPEKLKEIILAILLREKVACYGFIGYSMGCRLGLKLIEQQYLSPSKVILLVPEGLIQAKWYAMIEWLYPFSPLFRYLLLRHGKVILNISKMLVAVKILPTSSADFIQLNIEKEHRKLRVIGTWMSYKYFKIDWKKIEKKLLQSNASVDIILATKDKIFDYDLMSKVIKEYPSFKTHAINSNHFIDQHNKCLQLLKVVI